MKTISSWLMLLVVCAQLPARAQQAPATRETEYVVESYYKVQWGHQQEFLELFFKNYYPLIKKNIEAGRVVSVAVETPTNHMSEDSRWDYRLTVRYRNSTVATTTNSEEASWIVQLWPDQMRYKREEQRRFEILAAHWDMSVAKVSAPGTK